MSNLIDTFLQLLFVGLLIAGVIDWALPGKHEGKELKTIYRRPDQEQ